MRYGLVSPLGLPHAPWTSTSMDPTTGLLAPEGAVEIWVIVDRYTKMAHFVPLKTGAKKAADLARIFAREVWRIHGLPTDIVSDRDPRFTSSTWQTFIAILGVRPRMSTAFPSSDGWPDGTDKSSPRDLSASVYRVRRRRLGGSFDDGRVRP